MNYKENTIDVVVPVYNGEAFIVDALESIIWQTHKPRKIFVINDGSTDKTSELIKKVAGTSAVPIEIINQENKGLSSARNAGIKASESEYIAFLDADDLWYPTKLADQLLAFKNTKHQNLAVVYCGYDEIDENGKPKNTKTIEPHLYGNIFESLIDSNRITASASGVLVKRACLDEVGYFNENLSAFEDWDMWLRIAEKYQFDFIGEKLVSIRRHPQNMQRKYVHMLKNEISFYNFWSEKISDTSIPMKWRSNLETLIFLSLPSLSPFAYIRKNLSKKLYRLYFSQSLGSVEIYVLLRIVIKTWKKIIK